MANEEQLSVLKQSVEAWNRWREEHQDAAIDLSRCILNELDLQRANLKNADFNKTDFIKTNLSEADLSGGHFRRTDLENAILINSKLCEASFYEAILVDTNLTRADLTATVVRDTELNGANLQMANLRGAVFYQSDLSNANLSGAIFEKTNIEDTYLDGAILINTDLHGIVDIDGLAFSSPPTLNLETIRSLKGRAPTRFLRLCGLSDWEIETEKLYNPDLTSEEIDKILYRIHDLRVSQAIQISALFISYSHRDSVFVDKLETHLDNRGIRFWRDIHEMKAGRIERQIDRALRLNPTVLLILSEHSLGSDWVEHEVRTGRLLEMELKKDVLCPVALDDSWKNSLWPKRIMEQILEYNILDFSEWNDDKKFASTFNKLIDGLELFYK